MDLRAKCKHIFWDFCDSERLSVSAKKLKAKHKDFLKEKNEQRNFSHQNLRKAFRSIQTNLPHLFTFENHPNLNIPKTTNSCDGNFGQWKREMKMVNEFLGYQND